MDIVEVARRSGVPASTLRFYEEKGLLSSVGRRGLRRLFTPGVLERLALISLGRSAGFSLDEIARMFAPDGKVARDDLPALPCKDGEIRLLSLRVRVPGAPEPFHVAFWAVHRFFFGFGTGESLERVRATENFTIEEVTHSWRSSIEA